MRIRQDGDGSFLRRDGLVAFFNALGVSSVSSSAASRSAHGRQSGGGLARLF